MKIIDMSCIKVVNKKIFVMEFDVNFFMLIINLLV